MVEQNKAIDTHPRSLNRFKREEQGVREKKIEEKIDELRQDCNILAKIFIDSRNTIEALQKEISNYEKSNTKNSTNAANAIISLSESGYLQAIQNLVKEDNLATIKELHEKINTLQNQKTKKSNSGEISGRQILFNLLVLVVSVGTAVFVFMQNGNKQMINKFYPQQNSAAIKQ